MGLCLSLVITAIAATFAVTMVFSKQIYNGIISNISQRSHTYENAEEINRIISNYFYGDMDEYNNNLSAALAEGYVNGLSDGNSYYMTASEYAEYTEKTESGITGCGIEAAYDYTADDFVVTYVYEDSPAYGEGIRAGDVITAINNNTVTRSDFQKLSADLYGTKLKTVSVEYSRDNETKTADVMLGYRIPSVTGRIEGTVGYIRISRFYKNTADELKTMLESLKDKGAEGIVIDLRNTSEGTVKYAADAIDVIVPGSTGYIATTRDKNGKETTFTAESSSFVMNFSVLINSRTSGPAELFACDMRDMKQAQLVGTRTAGVGTMQEVFTLDDGSAILLTVALVIPKGGEQAVYDGIGVAPTMEVTLSSDDSTVLLLSQAEDNQLAAATSLLEQ